MRNDSTGSHYVSIQYYEQYMYTYTDRCYKYGKYYIGPGKEKTPAAVVKLDYIFLSAVVCTTCVR